MKMRNALVGLTAVGIALVSPLAASAGTTTVHAKLDSASVVPGPGDTDAKGTFKAKIKGGELCYTVKVKKAKDVTSIGVYAGAAGETGDLVVALEPADGKSSGCTTIVPDAEDTESTVSESEAALMASDPTGLYVQVSTVEFPDGAIRGQLK